MKLPNLFKNILFKEKKSQSNYFLTLTLGREKADAVIFEETLRHAKVIGHSREYFDHDLESIADESILNVLDKVISTAEKSLPENIETQNTIFGVDPSWVEGGKIKKDYLLKLKKISEELDLKPIGFIVTTEAISHFLQKEEGAPVSAILSEIGKNSLTATLIRGGRVIESKTAQLTKSAPETLDGLLKHFSTPEVLPSRIIVFGENNESMNQDFTGFSWSKSLPFLHLPQITPFENFLDAKAVLFGAASQMNFTVSDTSMLGTNSIDPDISDLAEVTPLKTEGKKEMINNDEMSDEFFGFVEGGDVSKETSGEIIGTSDKEITAETDKKIEEIPDEMRVEKSESKSLASNALLMFGGIKPIFSKLGKAIKAPKNITRLLSGKNKFLLIPIALVIIFLIFILYFFLFRNAVISITLSPKNAQKTQDVVFGENISTDAKAGTIKAKYINVSEDGKLTTPATGKKQTGDKAKGTVTIFNLSASPKTFSAGTTLTSPNNLDFTFDKNITIASGSGDATSPTPGKTDVSVTASTFGTQYNLPSGTKFSVGDNQTSIIAGKNDNAFSGGTTKDITVVSSDDLTKLSSDMVKSLQDKAKSDIQGKISSQEILLPEFVSTSFDLKNYSKKSGEEAASVNLTATISFKYIAYSKQDLEKFAQSLFERESGQNLEVNKENTSTKAEDIKIDKDNKTSATLTITTNLLPIIDGDSLANSVAGKSISNAESIISKIPQVSNVSISISPNPLFLPKLLPASPKKIKVMINKNG